MLQIICLVFVLLQGIVSENIVQTKNGPVRGKELTTIDGKTPYTAFFGIPFAEPPIGSRRFEPPEPKKSWDEPYNATTEKSICVQRAPTMKESEDCLYINIFVPKISKENPTLLPVMVWIYGGAFDGGSSSTEQYGPDHLLDKNVIVVTFNYRVGIFGFLSTGDLVVPGNNGMKDQVLAMKWTKENIRHFGGDSDQITIFGESAGAASVSYHLQSPLSKGLFHRAIIESGVSTCSWALSRNIPAISKKIAEDLNIDTSSSQKLVEGLKKVDYKKLQKSYYTNIATEYLKFNDPRKGLAFGPVIEPDHKGAFFKDDSYELLKDGNFTKVPHIIGFNSLEFGRDPGPFLTTLIKLYVFTRYDLNKTNLIPVGMNVKDEDKKIVTEKIRRKFFGFLTPIYYSSFKLTKFLSDDQFVRPTRQHVLFTSKHVPTYFYSFSYEGKLSGVQNRPFSGVSHGEELNYIWVSKHPATEQDKIVRDRVISMWTNFAKTGNPTPENSNLSITWKPSNPESTPYLDIGSNLKMKVFPQKASMQFWDKLFDTYGNPPYDTY